MPLKTSLSARKVLGWIPEPVKSNIASPTLASLLILLMMTAESMLSKRPVIRFTLAIFFSFSYLRSIPIEFAGIVMFFITVSIKLSVQS